MSLPTGLQYDELQRQGRPGAWRPLAGVPLLVLLFFSGQLVATLAVMAWLGVAGNSSTAITDKLSGDLTTPSFLALVNLGWAFAIVAVLVVALVLHGMRPGWVLSVTGRIRWRWLLVCLGLSVIALAATVAVSAVLPDQGGGSVDFDGGVNSWTSATRDFVLVVLLLTPLQAAGEEFVFRGYLAQSFGGAMARFGRRAAASVSVLVPALLFAFAHGLGQGPAIFVDRFGFGLAAGVLVLLTGGLEAGIAMHVLNNFAAFGLALAFGDMTEALNPTDGSWWALPVTLTQTLSYLLLCLWVARRMGIADRTTGPILEGQQARV